MAYDKVKIFEQAKEMIVKHKLFFIEDIVAFLPVSKNYFYDNFPLDSNEYDTLKRLLEQNRTELKVSMRSKWYKSNAPALQMALMKLICNEDERRMLAMNYTDHTSKGEKIDNKPNVIITDAETAKEFQTVLDRFKDEADTDV